VEFKPEERAAVGNSKIMIKLSDCIEDTQNLIEELGYDLENYDRLVRITLGLTSR
jgi:hypothetical protein